MYQKFFQKGGAVGHLSCNKLKISESQNVCGLSNTAGCQGDDQDPSNDP